MIRGVAMAFLIAVLALVVARELTVPDDTMEQASPRVLAIEAGKPPPPLDTDALAGVADVIVARPLLSPSRRPPDQPSNAGRTTSNTVDRSLPRLTGTIVGPNGGRAIFASADGKSRSVAEGDDIGAFKVRKINPGVVNLSGSDGEHVLRPTYVMPAAAGSTATTVGGEAVSSGPAADGRNQAKQRALFPGSNPGPGSQERAR